MDRGREPGMRLLAYQDASAVGPAILLIPAPIKRAYIFDLVARASVVRRWREAGRAVFLLEWTDPTGLSCSYDLTNYADHLLSVARERLLPLQARIGSCWLAIRWGARSQPCRQRVGHKGSRH